MNSPHIRWYASRIFLFHTLLGMPQSAIIFYPLPLICAAARKLGRANKLLHGAQLSGSAQGYIVLYRQGATTALYRWWVSVLASLVAPSFLAHCSRISMGSGKTETKTKRKRIFDSLFLLAFLSIFPPWIKYYFYLLGWAHLQHQRSSKGGNCWLHLDACAFHCNPCTHTHAHTWNLPFTNHCIFFLFLPFFLLATLAKHFPHCSRNQYAFVASSWQVSKLPQLQLYQGHRPFTTTTIHPPPLPPSFSDLLAAEANFLVIFSICVASHWYEGKTVVGVGILGCFMAPVDNCNKNVARDYNKRIMSCHAPIFLNFPQFFQPPPHCRGQCSIEFHLLFLFTLALFRLFFPALPCHVQNVNCA